MNRLFIYGTLLDKNVQMSVVGREVPGCADQLADYRCVIRKFMCGSYPDIIFQKGSIVAGKVLELTDMELERCDHYEGVEYGRLCVVLKSGLKAFVYKGK
jgi:gamma-glutamylcyclotransferase (GGCT)/AIG2-like uncharacterized protein YtfP